MTLTDWFICGVLIAMSLDSALQSIKLRRLTDRIKKLEKKDE